ncbi:MULTISPECIES: hypothetical protein [unclassified Lentimonas]|uniref:hypothetical protein n=1 Tax=unclassified Lentimonas TaxID=2630993 RepID=UPI00132A94F0|nr:MULTISPECIES: hypothetical protein [unclassified Lentimonas]CAA6692195.1 Unannotated [Lentimonas sp. CC19]CAA6694535.1 Unannotated [Lentimonas sp. CC10]CAA7071872.1 Unannotated [Lentimonas sp. CC11]
MNKRSIASLIGLVLLGSASVIIYTNSKQREEPQAETREEAIARMEHVNAEISRSLRFNQWEAKLQNDPRDRSSFSEMALELDNPTIEESDAKIAIHSLLSSMRTTVYRGDYPAGLNVEITNALLGDNPRKVAYLPMDSPRINEYGELVDEYGTAYWFHSKASNDLTITSAGPDKRLHTADDIRYPTD